MRNVSAVLLASLALVVTGSTVARATVLGPELLVNGSFELPVIGPGTFAVFATIPGWTSTTPSPGGIEVQRSVAGSPFSGLQHVELDSFVPSNMFQDVVTTPGGLYRVSFAYSPRPGVLDNGIQVFWDGVLQTTLAASGVGNNNTSWTVFQFDLPATLASTRLEFVDISFDEPVGGLGGYLDAVSVRQVIPEPGTVLLVALFALAAAFRRNSPLS